MPLLAQKRVRQGRKMDSDTTTKTKMMPFKRVKLSDGVIVWITNDRLDRLYEGLPILRWLCEEQQNQAGGGGKKSKEEEEEKEEENGHFDFALSEDHGIDQSDWTLLMDFFSPANLLPTSVGEWSRLKNVTDMLGGSDVVDKALKLDMQNRIVKPKDDSHELFHWLTVRNGDTARGGLSSAGLEWLRNRMVEGYVLVHDEKIDDGSLNRLQHYRKRKQPPPAVPAESTT